MKQDAIDDTFAKQDSNDSGRKSAVKGMAKAQTAKTAKRNMSDFHKAHHGATKNAKTLPIKTRLEHSNKRGSGLDTKANHVKFLQNKSKDLNLWTFTPVKLGDNSASHLGEITCRACNCTPFHLRSIGMHVLTKKHVKAVEKMKRHRKPKMRLQIVCNNAWIK